MSLAIVVLIIALSLLLGLMTFVQLLYLESLRLRTRDLPAIKFFKDTLEDKIRFPAEDGAGSFTLIKHTTILVIGILYFLVFADGQAWTWPEVAETMVASWLTMIVMAYVLPQVLYRRTEAKWLLPLTGIIRSVGLLAKPFVAVLDFFQSLVELTDDSA